MQKMLGNEHGGMNETLANLYALTGDEKYLKTAQRFNHMAVLEPPSKCEDKLNGLHANTQVPKFVGTARQYELTGDEWLHTASKFFWEAVALRRSYVIGGHSDSEHFFPVEEFSKHLSPATAETCNTHNMLKLTRHLFAWEPSAVTMDFYERALYNQILGSQEPREGMMAYFIPLKPGHFKVYNTPTDSFWCCTGTGVENHGKYGDTIFFHDDRSLLVNLFIPAELTWREKGLTVRQETRFPEQDTTRLTFRCQQPLELALKIRWPAWATIRHPDCRQRSGHRDGRKARQLRDRPAPVARRRPRRGASGDDPAHRGDAGRSAHGGHPVRADRAGRRIGHGGIGQAVAPVAQPVGFGPRADTAHSGVGLRTGRVAVARRTGGGQAADVSDARHRPAARRDAGALVSAALRALCGLLETADRRPVAAGRGGAGGRRAGAA